MMGKEKSLPSPLFQIQDRLTRTFQLRTTNDGSKQSQTLAIIMGIIGLTRPTHSMRNLRKNQLETCQNSDLIAYRSIFLTMSSMVDSVVIGALTRLKLQASSWTRLELSEAGRLSMLHRLSPPLAEQVGASIHALATGLIDPNHTSPAHASDM